MTEMPSLFISHGGPNIVIDPMPARDHLADLESIVGRPEAIVIVSAHFETDGVVVSGDPEPETVYDFGGFAPELYQMTYPARGNPELAARVCDLLAGEGLDARLAPRHGLDHGVWTPLMLAFPDAGIPVIPVSIDPRRDASWHMKIGRALAPLRRESVLVIGSGHITHNLGAFFATMRGAKAPEGMVEAVDAFTGWIGEALEAGDEVRLAQWAELAPHAKVNHPTDEHLMPLFAAWAAGTGPNGELPVARRVHRSVQNGFFAYESWLFGQEV